MPMPASSKPLGSGLDFSHIHYGDKAQRFETYSKAAREILSEKLQVSNFPTSTVNQDSVLENRARSRLLRNLSGSFSPKSTDW